MTDILALYLTLIAPVIGSFLGVIYIRLPMGLSLGGRSACDICRTPLAPIDLIPFVSFLVGFGRCRTCKNAIDPTLFVIELAALITILPIWWMFDPVLQLATAFLMWMLIPLAFLDAKHFWLPDVITLPLIGFGLVFNTVRNPDLFAPHLLAAISAYLFIWVLNFTYSRVRGHDGIGMGDAKLLAGAGAWLGPLALPWVLLVASMTALFAALAGQISGKKDIKKETEVPLGLFLAIAMAIVWLIITLPNLAPIGRQLGLVGSF